MQSMFKLGFDVQASYFEPGMSFAGTWQNGEDDYYEGNWSDFPEALRDGPGDGK